MTGSEAFDRSCLWRFRAKLLGIHDGDTITVLADTGFRGRHEVALRIRDIWAPELSMVGGELAMLRLTDILARRDMTELWNLRVVTQQLKTKVSETMSFSRYVGDCYIVEPNTGDLINVAVEMAQYGYDQPAA